MREIKFSCMWSDGESWMDLRYSLEKLENGMHWEEMSDNPMLRKYKLKNKRQFTGLNDRNGVEIYEGDIVSYIREKPKVKTVVYAENICAFLFGDDEIGDNLENIEVIGNIYQHSHLLDGD